MQEKDTRFCVRSKRVTRQRNSRSGLYAFLQAGALLLHFRGGAKSRSRLFVRVIRKVVRPRDTQTQVVSSCIIMFSPLKEFADIAALSLRLR